MALAGVACAASYDMDKGGDLFAGEFTLTFEIPADLTVTGDYDILAAYYQVNGGNYTVNAFKLNSDYTLTLDRGGNLSSTTLTNDVTLGTSNNQSEFKADGVDYTLTTPGTYTLNYKGGTNGSAAADLLLDGAVVASFTGGNHNMNGAQNGGDTLTLQTNDSYKVVATSYPGMPTVPEPTTATLSLLALAALAAKRRRMK